METKRGRSWHVAFEIAGEPFSSDEWMTEEKARALAKTLREKLGDDAGVIAAEDGHDRPR